MTDYKLAIAKFKALRLARGWTQLEVATDLNIHESTYRKIENCAITMTVPRFLELCQLFCITPNDAFSEADSIFDLELLRANYSRSSESVKYLREENLFLREQLGNLIMEIRSQKQKKIPLTTYSI